MTKYKAFLIFVVIIFLTSCDFNKKTYQVDDLKIVPVSPANFISENLLEGIIQKTVKLNGVETLCYVIKSCSRR